jgi:hypothetical protein
MAETTLNKKMRAFDDEVALTIAPFYLVHMLQRTLPAGFIAHTQRLARAARQPTVEYKPDLAALKFTRAYGEPR